MQPVKLGINDVHQCIYMEIVYAKCKEIKLMEHVNLFWSRLNIPTLLHACEDNLHWKETVFLHTHFAEQGINLDLAHQGINLDHKRVVQTIRLSSQQPLIQQYLLHVQRDNIAVVNEDVDEQLILRGSIADYDALDQIALAQQLQKHEQLEFRRIAAPLYSTNKRYTTSITQSKQDGLWQDGTPWRRRRCRNGSRWSRSCCASSWRTSRRTR